MNTMLKNHARPVSPKVTAAFARRYRAFFNAARRAARAENAAHQKLARPLTLAERRELKRPLGA